MDRHRSELHHSNWRMGEVIRDAGVKIFQIETTLNTDTFADTAPSVLQKREWEWTLADRASFIGMKAGLDRMPTKARRKIFQSWRAPYGMTWVQAGEVERGPRGDDPQRLRPAAGAGRGPDRRADDGAALHLPLQRQLDHEPDPGDVPGARVLLQPLPGRPLVREGGVLIMSHPTPWEFHPVHHPSYIDFFEQVLAETTDPVEIEAKYEKELRRGRVVHPPVPDRVRLPRRPPLLHVVLGRHALEHLGGVIIVGGDCRAVRRLGFKPASTLRDAFEMAADVVGPRPTVTHLHNPPILLADDVSVRPLARIAAIRHRRWRCRSRTRARRGRGASSRRHQAATGIDYDTDWARR